MKKIAIILAAVLLTALLSMTAFAAEVYEADAQTGAFSVSYTGTAGEFYAIVAIDGIVEEGTAPTITENSIQYIDQLTAGVDGSVNFANVLIKTDGNPCTVFLGGSDLEAPVLLGWFNKTEEAEGFTVSGTITTAGREAKVTLYKNDAPVYTADTTNGAYTISDVTADTYKLVVTAPAHVSYTKNEFAVAGDAEKSVEIKGGDIVVDGAVNFDDFADILLNYNSNEDSADINGDGVVNFDDFATIISNYQAQSIVE